MPAENLRGSLLMVLAMIGCGGAIIFSILARLRGHGLVPPRAWWRPLVLRNLGEMVAAASFVSAFTLATLSSASAILQAVPLAVTLGAALFLGEPVGWRRWSAIGAGLVGVLLIIQPGLSGFAPASLLAVVTVAALALRDLASRALPARITGTQISVWAFASLVPAGLLMMLVLGSVPVLPAAPDLLRLGGAFVGGAGYLAIVGATRTGDVAAVVPFRYTRLVFAMLLGALVFGERPGPLMLAGAALVVGAGLYTIWRETVTRRALQAETAARETGTWWQSTDLPDGLS